VIAKQAALAPALFSRGARQNHPHQSCLSRVGAFAFGAADGLPDCTIYGAYNASNSCGAMVGSKIDVVFFETPAGNQPALNWRKGLPRDDRSAVGQDLMRVQWRWPIGMPLCRNPGDGLWEVRSSLPNNRIARIIFCSHAGELVARHGFIKNARKTPQDELDLALKRMKELAL
jgi:phage-related protein